MAMAGLSTAGASSNASTAATISSPAGSIQSARGPPNSAIAPGLVGQHRRIGLERPAGNRELLGPAQPGKEPFAERARSGFVGAVEQIETRGRAGPVERSAKLILAAFIAWGAVRAVKVASRATIWSATTSARRSTALCSAATVAYSELTMSIPASDPAVASSTTAPVASSTSR